MILTTPILFARARGIDCPIGPHHCFYCGAMCGEAYPARKYVADSFTERDCVVAPGSDYVCGGCVECLRSDLPRVTLIDGEAKGPKEGGKRKPKPGAEGTIQVRWWSWIITEREALAATPAHRSLIRDVCLNPPEPPFAICIADGNKHQLFRTPVNLTPGRVALNCEGERVDYDPESLRERLMLVAHLVAVIGKGPDALARLADPLAETSVALQLARELGPDESESLFGRWRAVRNESLTSLAVWLTGGKDECRLLCGLTAAAGKDER